MFLIIYWVNFLTKTYHLITFPFQRVPSRTPRVVGRTFEGQWTIGFGSVSASRPSDTLKRIKYKVRRPSEKPEKLKQLTSVIKCKEITYIKILFKLYTMTMFKVSIYELGIISYFGLISPKLGQKDHLSFNRD